MAKKNFSNLDEEIKDIVQNAINTMDFYQLNRNIENTIQSAISEVKNAFGEKRSDTSFHKQNQSSSSNSFDQNNSTYHKNVTKKSTNSFTMYPSQPVGKISGILFTIFGWILLPITGIAILVLTLIGVIMSQLNLFGTIAFGILPFLLIGLFMTIKGSSIRARLRRFQRYTGIFKNKGYYSIKDLSSQTQLSQKFIVKDLKKMILLGMFPEGHIDKQNTCVMLNQQSYQQYMQLLQNKDSQAVKKSQPTATSKDNVVSNKEATQTTNHELQKAIQNGRSCILQIREANDAIPGEEISLKLDRLETVIDKIFTHVEAHPDQLPEIEKFMEYYLPTTLKLVTAYKEFDLQPVQGENIRSAKAEIEATLNTINHAFETLLDSLFEDAAMDISTDISVLETMLAQEGLTKHDFK